MKYTREFTIGCQYTDPNGFVRAAELWRVMQETAGLHIKEKYYSVEEMQKMDMAFVMSKLCLRFLSSVKPHTGVVARTWARGRSAYKLFRNYEMEDKFSGELLCESATVWALIRLSDRKLMQTDSLVRPIPTCEADVSASIPQKVDTMPVEAYHDVGVHTVGYVDLDTYAHMNNMRYIDLICEHLPLTEDYRVKEICVEYRNEAVFGDRIDISVCRDGDSFFIKGTLSGGRPCFVSRADIERIV